MEVITIVPPAQQFTEFMSMPDGINKNVHYYNNIQGMQFAEANLCKKDGLTYYSVSCFKIVKSTKSSYYIKRTAKDGFTMNEKGKIKVWFGKSIYNVPHLIDLFKYYNFNWLHANMYQFITKTIVEKMLSGKITNNLEICKEYIKVMKLKCSPALLVKMFTSDNCGYSKQDFLRQASVAKDVNHLIESLTIPNNKGPERYNLLIDMIKEAQMLEEKIDFTWSTNRLKEVHKEWTEKIMKVQIDALDDSAVPFVELFDRYTPPNFKLLKTQKEVFYEGSTMKHCVYTAYWNSIKSNRYLAYHVTLDDEEATLGLYVDPDRILYNQCYTRYNQSVSKEMFNLVKEFTDSLNEQVKRDGTLLAIKTKENNIVNELPF